MDYSRKRDIRELSRQFLLSTPIEHILLTGRNSLNISSSDFIFNVYTSVTAFTIVDSSSWIQAMTMSFTKSCVT